MRITNNHHLPEAVFNLIAQDNYNPGSSDYSVTTLLRPPRMVQLERRYAEHLEEDAIDRVWSLFGSVAHHMLEQHAADSSLSEERMYVEVLGRKIGGQVDCYHDGVITDYKITSAWTLVYGSRYHEWEEQLNLYAHIFRENGYPVERLQIVAILRDWDKNKAKADRNYPQVPIVIIPLNLWEDKKAVDFIDGKVDTMIWNEEYSDDKLDPCTPEDMWEQPTKYAMMKDGRKTAVRVFETKEEAKAYRDEMLGGDKNAHYYTQTRPGKRTRCSEYCKVNKWCSQYQKYLEEQSGISESEVPL